jgi:crotonobetainyl-CoA:carnitine CoA-transferase CaiB-like acyl-CoA transferase
MPKPPLRTLEGVNIVAFTQFLLGPAGVQYLNDLGADVIKVEPPGGAWERHWSGGDLYLNGESVFFMMAHRNCRDITLNLKHPDGLDIARRLVARADVVVQNFRAGALERLGLGYEAARAINPRIIYVSCSGYGERGPYRDLPGQDLLLQGLTGLASVTGAEDGPPVAVGGAVIDQHGAALLAMGVLAALLERGRSGEGQLVEVTMAQAGIDLQQEGMSYELNGYPVGRGPRNLASGFHPAPYGVFQTKDDYIVMSMSPVARLNTVLDSEELRAYEAHELRFDERREISRIIGSILVQKTTREWRDLFRPVDVWCAPVHRYDQTFEDPAIQYLDPVLEVDHPTAGRVRLLKHPISYSAGEPELRRPPPMLGEHTDEILRELGYDDERIRALRTSGAV